MDKNFFLSHIGNRIVTNDFLPQIKTGFYVLTIGLDTIGELEEKHQEVTFLEIKRSLGTKRGSNPSSEYNIIRMDDDQKANIDKPIHLKEILPSWSCLPDT